MGNKRALICGISGQDGSYLADFLIKRGYDVCGTSRDAEMSPFDNLVSLGIREKVHCLSMNLIDFRSVMQVLMETDPNEIYNLARKSSVGLSFQLPVETLESIAFGTLNLLEAIRFMKPDVRLYNAASGDCFGDLDEATPATERSPFRPRSPYGVAKASAFWEVANYREAYGLYACSGILFNHESSFRPARFVTRKIVETASRIAFGSRDKLTIGDLSIIRDWGWAPEYVAAMWQILQANDPDDYVIATGESHSLQEFVAACFSAVDLDWQTFTEVDDSLFRPSEIETSYANPAKAKADLGWQAQTSMHGLVESLMRERMDKLKTA